MPARIVVIDDAEAIVALYADLLNGEGYDVVATFAGPPTEPQVIEQYHPDLIIMDWLFGSEGTGMQVLDMLKTAPSTAATPVIVCTAAQREIGMVRDILMQRGVRILHKPFAIDDLLALIRVIVG